MDMERKLIDRKTLGQLHPALNKRWRVDWLIRTRKIPVIKIGRRVFFDECEILIWIKKHSIPAFEGNIGNG